MKRFVFVAILFAAVSPLHAQGSDVFEVKVRGLSLQFDGQGRITGGSAQVTCESRLDGYGTDWDASFNWPYFGLFMPLLSDAKATWQTYGYNSAGQHDPRRATQMSYRLLNGNTGGAKRYCPESKARSRCRRNTRMKHSISLSHSFGAAR
jgi:hypothetical protein